MDNLGFEGPKGTINGNGISLDEFHQHNQTPQSNEKDHEIGKTSNNPDLLYGVEDVPPWYMCIFLGFQHYLEMIGATVACPFFLTPALCMLDDDPNRANIISTLVFMSGIITLLQSTFGTRLPIVQGGSFSYLIPALSIMSLPKWKCPDGLESLSEDERTECWQLRMRELQGAIIFAALFETLLAFFGIIGLVLKYITPLTVAPAIFLIGISLFKHAAKECAKNWTVAIACFTSRITMAKQLKLLKQEKQEGSGFSKSSAVYSFLQAECFLHYRTLVLLILFSQHLRNIKPRVPCGRDPESTSENKKLFKFPLFQVFPVLMSLLVVWSVCGILTVTDMLKVGDLARTDAKAKLFQNAPWFRIPYPFQWGWPTVSIGAVLGVISGVLASTVESIGDYYACARIGHTTIPPTNAINRGIFMQGFGCVLGGFWGSGNGSTSYSNNIGTISVTKVASRRVIQVSGTIMIILSLIGKAGAIFIGLPDPIVGGMFCFIMPLIMAVAINILEDVDLSSTRNIFVASFAIFFGLMISEWVSGNPGVIDTGNETMDSIFQILLGTGMFIAGFLGFLLDNTIPGTPKERGLTHFLPPKTEGLVRDENYDLPFGMATIKRMKFLRWLPISPTFEKHPIEHLPSCRRKNNADISY